MRSYILLSLCALLCGVSCTEKIGREALPTTPSGKMEVVISGSSSNTRTSLDPDGRTTHWSMGDRIAVWATTPEGYALQAEPFALYTYNGIFSSADFSATITPMASGSYTYYATYPLPTSAEGTKVTYKLPAVQSGTYQGGNDILVADPVTGSELGANPRDELALSFRHLLHMVRIEIPQGRNLFGEPVRRLEITFPTEVVGTISFDAANPEGTLALTNSSRTLTLDFATEGFTDTEQCYAYAFVYPGEINGEMTFRAYNAAGYQANPITTTIHKTMQADHVTPISLTIPTARPLTHLDFHVGTNNLGEELTSIHLTAPEGLKFAVPFSVEGGSSISASGKEGIFTASIYADQYTAETLAGQPLTIAYESESALIPNHSISTPGTIHSAAHNPITMSVPYLFDENFDTVTTFHNDDQNTTSRTSAGSSDAQNISPEGWTGARVGAEAGVGLRICCRGEQAVWVAASYTGRADSPTMSHIKEGKTVKLQVAFDYSMNRQSSKNSANQHYFALGMHSSSGPQNSTVSGVGKLGSAIADNTAARDIYSPNEGSFSRIDRQASYLFQGCTSASRFVWEVYIKSKCPDGYYNNWVYIDNVKVSIAQ